MEILYSIPFSFSTQSNLNLFIFLQRTGGNILMKDEKNQKIIDDYDYLSNAASMQDCTGLIPSEPISIEELESYEDLYHFLPPNAKVANIKPEEQSK
ncbi:hypothetical protein G5A78_01430 [[Clostridium] scindens]|nr:hypothetical protein [Lachnospiraceae bacterium]NSJ13540.1 hypothetical protein [[Clostridium] scindens]QYX28399.1 hypothetical protein K0036_07345 [[Clostridium] scindens]